MPNESAESERLLLQRAIAASRNGITIARPDGDGLYPLIYANPAFYRLTGYAPEDIIGRDCKLLQGAANNQPALEVLRAALASGTEATVLLRNFRKDGVEFLNELTVSPVFNEDGKLSHYVGLQNDVTQRENDARSIAALNLALTQRGQELEHLNRGLRSFSAAASHDLRAPLSAIKGYSLLLKKAMNSGVAENRSAHYIARIDASVDLMNQLMDSLLQLARAAAVELKHGRCDLSAIARQVVDAERSAVPTIDAEVFIESDLFAQGDPSLLLSVLQNLLGNALKYSSKTPGARIHFGREVGGLARFFVRDNGAGFDMQKAEQLFNPFQRFHAQSDFPGTGVGLSTVRKIISRHGGLVSAESAPGQGAVFYFTIGAMPVPSAGNL